MSADANVAEPAPAAAATAQWMGDRAWIAARWLGGRALVLATALVVHAVGAREYSVPARARARPLPADGLWHRRVAGRVPPHSGARSDPAFSLSIRRCCAVHASASVT
jgi:hypothetical protein